MRILIAGAGVGGLVAALSLHASGWTDVRIVESARSLRPAGLGVNIQPDAVRELAALDLLDHLVRHAVPTGELRLLNKYGQSIWTEPRGTAAGYRWPQLAISRSWLQATLVKAVRERLGEATIATASRVVGCVPGGNTPSMVTLQDEVTGSRSTTEADLVIGADGIHSAVRAALYPDEGPPPGNGMLMWRGMAWCPPFLTGRTMAVAGDDVRRIVLYPVDEDRQRGLVLVNWVAAHPAGTTTQACANWSDQAPLAAVVAEFGGWGFDWIDLPSVFSGTRRIYRYPMVDRNPLLRWSFGNVTLLGDAAHAMYPMGSNGATQSIVDGRVLAHALAGSREIGQALADYERRRMPVMTRLQNSNRSWGPEAIITTVHRRAPTGFAHLHDVVPADELALVASRYAETAGSQVDRVNHRPSLSNAKGTMTP